MAEQFSIPTEGDVVADKYRILEELGRGSYGVVFRAEQSGIGRFVALKTLLPKAFLQTDIVQRFQREANLISRLQHPNIVTLFDFGQSEGGVLYMAMELIHGQQLSDIMTAEGPMGTERSLLIIKQVLAALEAAHREGIVHRDLKPENIVLTQLGDREDVVKVLDFGIAKLTVAEGEHESALKTLTVQGYVLGTPHYMSPENITGDPVDHRADLYAVGIMLYEMLAGTHPFDAPSPSAVLVRHLNDPPPPLPDAELERSDVGRAIRMALAKEPEDRIGSASDFIDLLEGRLDLPPEPVPPSPPKRIGGIPLWLIGAGGVTVILLSVGIGFILYLVLDRPNSAPGGGDVGEAVVVTIDAGSDEDAGVEGDVGAQVDVGGLSPDASSADAGGDGAAIVARADAGAETPRGGGAGSNQAPAAATRDAGSGGAKVEPNVISKVATTKLHFVSDPPKAQVTVNGTPIGFTPCSKFVRREGGKVKVVISKIGYKTSVMSVNPTEATQRVSVKLKRGRIKLTP